MLQLKSELLSIPYNGSMLVKKNDIHNYNKSNKVDTSGKRKVDMITLTSLLGLVVVRFPYWQVTYVGKAMIMLNCTLI